MKFFEKLKEDRIAMINFWIGILHIDLRNWYHIRNHTTGEISDSWYTEYEIDVRDLKYYEDYEKIPFLRTMFRWSFPFVHRAKTMFIIGILIGLGLGYLL